MINKKAFSPYIRVAMFSTLVAPYKIDKRVIFDYEIILISDGKCKITIDGIEHLCRKNDVVFLRPGVPHKFECVDNCDFVQPHIHFDFLYSAESETRVVSYKPKEAMSEEEKALIQTDYFGDVGIPDVFVPYDPDEFKRVFFEIIELFQNKEYNYELLYKAKMMELFSYILAQFESKKLIKPDTVYNPIVAVKDYIDNNYLSVITLENLSKQFYINKYTLIRKFKEFYKQSPMAYYHEKRIEYIKHMLMTTNLSITLLCEKLNFSDIYSFSRFFKKSVGCSPTNYRKK